MSLLLSAAAKTQLDAAIDYHEGLEMAFRALLAFGLEPEAVLPAICDHHDAALRLRQEIEARPLVDTIDAADSGRNER